MTNETSEPGIDRLDELNVGDRVEFRTSGSEGEPSAVVTESVVDPPFPPEADEPMPGSLTLALEKREVGTVWNFSQDIDPADGDLTGEIEVDVRACIDVRHPPRYRWRDRGVLESCEVVATEEVEHA